MASQNNDIEKYLKGELNSAERHALEQKALQDPFLADALEGAEEIGNPDFAIDVALLKSAIDEKTRNRRTTPKIINLHGWGLYFSIAASLLLLAVSSYIVFLSIDQQKQETSTIAQSKPANDMKSSAITSDTLLDTDNNNASTEPIVAEAETPSADSGERQPVQPRQQTRNSAATQPREQIAQLHVESVSGEFRRRENEREVEVELSETPIIVRNEASEEEGLSKNEQDQLTINQKAKPAAPVLSPLPPMNADSVQVAMTTIRGKVVAADGSEIPGVNVYLKGSALGTVTDMNGNYEINVADPKQTLVFGFIGYTSQEVLAQHAQGVNIKLEEDVSSLSEVVVTGYSADKSSTPVFEMAEPVGGRKAFQKYLEQEVKYPETAIVNKVEGKVTIQFTVTPGGELTDFKIIKGLGFGCDEELIRLIMQGPQWQPSKSNGQTVKEDVKVRLKFELPH